jgi:hypothetical protein
MSDGSNLDYSVKIDDADLVRMVSDLQKTQVELKKLSRDAGDVAASLAKYEAIDFSKMVQSTQKSGGNNAVKALITDSAAATGGVNKITSALFSMNAVLSGNIKSIALMAGKGGLIVGTFLAAYEVGKRLAELTFGLLDKLVSGMPGVNAFQKYYQDAANAAQFAMRQNQITMTSFVRDANNAAEAINKSLQRIEKNNSRRTSVEKSDTTYQRAAGNISAEREIDLTREGRVRNALDSKGAAQREFRTVSKNAGNLKMAYDQAEYDYSNIRSQASGASSPEMGAALKSAKEVRDKIRDEYESTMKTLEGVRQTLVDTVADADAEIERANNEAATQFEQITKANEQRDAAVKLSSEQEEGKAKRERLVIESQRRYHEQYDPLSDQDKLARTEKNIGSWKKNLSESTTEKDRLSATQRLEEQLQERDRLRQRIGEAAGRVPEKKAEEARTRADNIKSAQGNIAQARERSVSGAGIGDVFSRMYDIRKGRSPDDQAAQQTAENTRIIAENTALLKNLGVVK